MPYLIVANKKMNNDRPKIGWYGNSEDAGSVDSLLIKNVSKSNKKILDYCPDYESFAIHLEWWLAKAEYSYRKPIVAHFLGLFRRHHEKT